MDMKAFNDLPADAAKKIIEDACHSPIVGQKIADLRPFQDFSALLDACDVQWFNLPDDQVLLTLEHHPKIGDLESLRKKYAAVAEQAKTEQGKMGEASEETLADLKKYNELYEKKHSFRFMVCATGKAPEEMLAIMQDRIGNSSLIELRQASVEQAKITRLRLQKVISA
uniref:2-oxo-4-hydroxy-4-carboxy-5-ureidoimidazoline decarboxylase n=1 Tax=Nephromyces sp. MMRI TaxID=2496275 RepID=A0A3Q8UCB3_9APIC|nr:2-oxo-4-hydroxy-4-carboxy-5-ureidoimidazoline decarboxylase [Nephromyces sp. MMRI]